MTENQRRALDVITLRDLLWRLSLTTVLIGLAFVLVAFQA